LKLCEPAPPIVKHSHKGVTAATKYKSDTDRLQEEMHGTAYR